MQHGKSFWLRTKAVDRPDPYLSTLGLENVMAYDAAGSVHGGVDGNRQVGIHAIDSKQPLLCPGTESKEKRYKRAFVAAAAVVGCVSSFSQDYIVRSLINPTYLLLVNLLLYIFPLCKFSFTKQPWVSEVSISS